MSASRRGRRMEIAHRGYAAEAPENTIAALRRAGRRADAVEIDIRRCGSGELVVLHDAEVDRLTDGTGQVSELSLSELRALDVLGSGESIPTLDDALAAVPQGVAVNAELKASGIAADAVAALDAVANRAIVSSFSEQALRETRAYSASIPTAYLADRLRDRPVTTAVELDCQFVHPRFTLCFYSPLVARARELGLGVNVWTVDDPLVVRALCRLGVDGVVTDRSGVVPDRYRTVAGVREA
ncbi:glycerophosphodiester phosphodiesterase [Natronoarchaeum rubrum]|uniref:glycerophosphodiester phosphodiesterase n=1 Tax=Natronoarchaeum rubrum TaxID=755311 RepID=UPI00211126E9|nr:glycerophosphodiester phosphodiesterase family protein [Natronoarchaeum rubrum]